MDIGIFSDKGGVGKTPLSYFIALEKAATVITNDESIISNYDKCLFLENIEHIKTDKENPTIVYDFGGWVDKGVLNLLKKLDYVIVPFKYKVSSIDKTNHLISVLESNSIKAITVLTQIPKSKFDKNEESIREIMDFEIDFVLFESEFFEYVTLTESTLKELSKKQKNDWKNTIPTLEKLLQKLK